LTVVQATTMIANDAIVPLASRATREADRYIMLVDKPKVDARREQHGQIYIQKDAK
jgi:hypothetical protein